MAERLRLHSKKGEENRIRYKVPPTIEQIDRVIHYMGLKQAQVESLFLLPTGTLKRVRYSGRTVPCPYWHFFYIVLWMRNEYQLPPYPKKETDKNGQVKHKR